MSEYTRFYTPSDVTVFLQNPVTGVFIMIDTLFTVGWQERLDSGPLYGVGNPIAGFFNSGNVIVNGILQLNFTHDEYMATMLEYVMGGQGDQYGNINLDTDFGIMSTEELFNYRRSKVNQKIKESLTGIQALPSGFTVQIVFNNGNMYHGDQSKSIELRDCKMVGSSIFTGTLQAAQVTQQFTFLAKVST